MLLNTILNKGNWCSLTIGLLFTICTPWLGGEWRAPTISTPDKNNLIWQSVKLAGTSLGVVPRRNRFNKRGANKPERATTWTYFQLAREDKGVVKRCLREFPFFSVTRPLTSYVAAVELVVAAADHAFLSGYNDKAVLSTATYPPHSSRGGWRQFPGTRNWAWQRTRP